MKKFYNSLFNSLPGKGKEAARCYLVGTLSGILCLGKGRRLQAFTLVELIVVITILAILGTIAFISLQGYSSASRDSVRISDVGNIVKMLELQRVVGEKVPKPEESIELTASGILIAYQGVAGEKTLGILGVSNGGKDPLENTYYTYTTNANLTKYQIIGFLEDGLQVGFNFLKNGVGAKDLSNRTIYIRGDELGTLLEIATSNPADRLGENIDVLNTTDEYKAVFNEDVILTGTGEDLFSDYYNRSTELLNNEELAKFDENLVLYMDMESTTNSGSNIVMKDFSRYGNNGGCYNTGILVDCGGVSGPQFEGEGMYFDGNDDWINNGNDISLNPQNITIFVKAKFLGNGLNSNYYPRIIGKGATTSSEQYAIRRSYNTEAGNNYNKFLFRLYPEIRNALQVPSVQNIDTNSYIDSFLTYDGYSTNIYLNGILDVFSTGVFSGNILPSNRDLIIGNTSWVNGYTRDFYGYIDEVRIYNRALNQTEVKTLYESFKK